MIARDWKEADLQTIKALHDSMDIGYAFPFPQGQPGPLYVIKKAVENGEAQIIAAGAVKIIGEAFLWINGDETPRKRFDAIRRLSAECAQAGRELGLDEVSAWIPPHVESEFAHALGNLGWLRSPWASWSKRL